MLKGDYIPSSNNSVQFSYCFDRSLELSRTIYPSGLRLGLRNPDINILHLLYCVRGYHSSQDTWIPVIKELFRLSSESPSPVKVGSVWAVERPNHGEAVLLNAKLLKQHYSVQFSNLQYATAIHAFLTSNFLSVFERNNLVGVGHSGGGGALIQRLSVAYAIGIKFLCNQLF
ncbi:hypothetical protein B0H17DRAFT_549206 [Mycena rosella]|uniref:Uncharacterized protein n=1 Tax=Mycena rosella TaxID=1033263 RepID=A0AAD7BSV9_MYCRO|nr:hypothetical protein B0H17DRAFT_549206 [Mycena rosella]